MATCGIASGAKNRYGFLHGSLDKRGIGAVITQTGCMGYCYAELIIEVTLPGQEPVVFGYVDTKRLTRLLKNTSRQESW